MVGLFSDLIQQPRELKLRVSEPATRCALEMFAEASYSDMCEDAHMREAIIYLRGCSGLCIPDAWRPLLPQYF